MVSSDRDLVRCFGAQRRYGTCLCVTGGSCATLKDLSVFSEPGRQRLCSAHNLYCASGRLARVLAVKHAIGQKRVRCGLVRSEVCSGVGH